MRCDDGDRSPWQDAQVEGIAKMGQRPKSEKDHHTLGTLKAASGIAAGEQTWREHWQIPADGACEMQHTATA